MIGNLINFYVRFHSHSRTSINKATTAATVTIKPKRNSKICDLIRRNNFGGNDVTSQKVSVKRVVLSIIFSFFSEWHAFQNYNNITNTVELNFSNEFSGNLVEKTEDIAETLRICTAACRLAFHITSISDQLKAIEDSRASDKTQERGSEPLTSHDDC